MRGEYISTGKRGCKTQENICELSYYAGLIFESHTLQWKHTQTVFFKLLPKTCYVTNFAK